MDGELSFDRSDFTHCRAYQANSVVHFGEVTDAGPGEAVPAPRPRATAASLPPSLRVAIALAAPVAVNQPVGTPVEARVTSNVESEGKIVLPKGALVHGRIRRIHRYDARKWSVELEFTDVEANGVSSRFYADLVSVDQFLMVAIPAGRADYKVALAPLPGVASLYVSGTFVTLPAGLRMIWRTTGLQPK
jgi:hypothetical protein